MLMESSSPPSWSLLILIPLFTLTCTLLFKTFSSLLSKPKTTNSNLPPGPKPWPVIGNLNLIGPLPHQSLHELSRQYGPIMKLQFGSFPVIIASSAEAAKLFLQTHDSVFASRPQTAAGKLTTYNYSNITWAPYGPYWRQGRKIFLNELFSAKRLGACEHIRVEELCAFMSRLFALSGEKVALKVQLSRVTFSVMSRITLGKNYFTADDEVEEIEGDGSKMVKLGEFQAMLDELFVLNGVLNIGDWIPWLGFLDLQGYEKRMTVLKKRFDRFHDHVLGEHKAKRKGSDGAKDLVDLLLDLADDPHLEVKLSYDSVEGFTQDLLAGGTDTSATTVEWAMSELIKQPHLIEKATAELDKVVGKNRWVSESDIAHLPFIDAIIKETVRKHPAATLLAPHLALHDCQVGGFHVSKGTRAFINTWSIGRDPSLWDRPEEFRPERFLEAHKEVAMRGQSFELLPFGSGRRMCPGFSLGLKMISSFIANLLHGFTWKLPEGLRPEDMDMDELYGLVTTRKNPLVVIMEPRLPTHLYESLVIG